MQKKTKNIFSFSDFLSIAGLSMLGYGLFLFEPWVSFVVCGAVLLAGGIVLSIPPKGGGEK